MEPSTIGGVHEALDSQALHGKKKPINIKKFGGTSPYLDCSHAMDVSRLSRGNVPSVPQTFCSIYVALHRAQVGTSRVSLGIAPKSSPGHLPGIPMPPKSSMCVLFIVFPSADYEPPWWAWLSGYAISSTEQVAQSSSGSSWSLDCFRDTELSRPKQSLIHKSPHESVCLSVCLRHYVSILRSRLSRDTGQDLAQQNATESQKRVCDSCAGFAWHKSRTKKQGTKNCDSQTFVILSFYASVFAVKSGRGLLRRDLILSQQGWCDSSCQLHHCLWISILRCPLNHPRLCFLSGNTEEKFTLIEIQRSKEDSLLENPFLPASLSLSLWLPREHSHKARGVTRDVFSRDCSRELRLLLVCFRLCCCSASVVATSVWASLKPERRGEVSSRGYFFHLWAYVGKKSRWQYRRDQVWGTCGYRHTFSCVRLHCQELLAAGPFLHTVRGSSCQCPFKGCVPRIHSQTQIVLKRVVRKSLNMSGRGGDEDVRREHREGERGRGESGGSASFGRRASWYLFWGFEPSQESGESDTVAQVVVKLMHIIEGASKHQQVLERDEDLSSDCFCGVSLVLVQVK